MQIDRNTSVAAMNVWQQVVDTELVGAHLGIAGDVTLEDAAEALKKLIRWHIEVATDPKTNGGKVLAPAAAMTAAVELPPPDSYKHTLDSTEGLPGNQPEVRRTESHVSPFGTPGVDFSSEFPVTVELLYTEKQVREILAAQAAKEPTE